MKKLFTTEIRNTLFQSVFIALLVFFLQNYLLKLWAPKTAGETLKKQNYISAKKDVYFEAVDIVARTLSGVDFHQPVVSTHQNIARVIGTTLPKEYEVNACLIKLYLYCDNQVIINSYKNIFKNGYNPIEESKNLIKYIREDMGNRENLSIIDSYEYIQLSRDTSKYK